VPWLIGPALISTLSVYFAPGLFLAKRTDLTWIPQGTQLAVVLIAGLVLIPRFQLVGVVGSRYVSTLALFVVVYGLSQRHYPIATEWRPLALMSLLLAAGGALANLVSFQLVLVNLLARTAIAAAAASAMAYVLIGNPANVRLALRSLFANPRSVAVK
jgi:O-antigen/teichoic acid export membrane protein